MSLGSSSRAVCLPLCSEAALPVMTVLMDTLKPAIVEVLHQATLRVLDGAQGDEQ